MKDFAREDVERGMKFIREPDDVTRYLPEMKHLAGLTWNIRDRYLIMRVVVGGGDEASGFTAEPGCKPFVFAESIDDYTHVRIILRDSRWNFRTPAGLSRELAFLDSYWRKYANGYCVPIEHVDTILKALESST